jgi:hypothetical protein
MFNTSSTYAENKEISMYCFCSITPEILLPAVLERCWYVDNSVHTCNTISTYFVFWASSSLVQAERLTKNRVAAPATLDLTLGQEARSHAYTFSEAVELFEGPNRRVSTLLYLFSLSPVKLPSIETAAAGTHTLFVFIIKTGSNR